MCDDKTLHMKSESVFRFCEKQNETFKLCNIQVLPERDHFLEKTHNKEGRTITCVLSSNQSSILSSFS